MSLVYPRKIHRLKTYKTNAKSVEKQKTDVINKQMNA